MDFQTETEESSCVGGPKTNVREKDEIVDLSKISVI